MKLDSNRRLQPAAAASLIVGVIALAGGLGYMCLTPKTWQAQAKVRVESRGRFRSEGNATKQPPPNESPYMNSERQFMRSDELFGHVIENLHLREKWGNNLQPGALMGSNQALKRLRSEADVHVIPRTSVLEIQVASEDPAEIAPIANEIARLYCDYRESQRNAVTREKLAGLQSEWDAQNDKLSRARQQLEKVVLEIQKQRAAAAGSLYTPEALASMQADHDRREAAVMEEEAQMNRLKTLKSDELRLLLPTLVTNEALDTSLEHAELARRALAEIRAKPGADPGDIKNAGTLAEDAEQRLQQAMVGIITEREADLAMHKAMLEKLEGQLKSARTNVDELSPDNPAYLAARQRVEQVEQERDRLKDRLMNEDAREALSPLSLSAQMVDSAERPSTPTSPDRRVGSAIIGSGAAICLAGVLLFWMAAQAKPAPKRAPAPLPFSKLRQN